VLARSLEQAAHSDAASGANDRRRPKDVVGPNAIIQTEAALVAAWGREATDRLMAAAGLAHYRNAPPTALVPEAEPARLFAAIRAARPAAEADAVLREAGRLTANYILAHRIPQPAQRLLRALPLAIAVRALLAAIRAHAWTFAGSGHVTIGIGFTAKLAIDRNPLATPGCPWHVGVLETLFRNTVAPATRVTHCRLRDTHIFAIQPKGR